MNVDLMHFDFGRSVDKLTALLRWNVVVNIYNNSASAIRTNKGIYIYISRQIETIETNWSWKSHGMNDSGPTPIPLAYQWNVHVRINGWFQNSIVGHWVLIPWNRSLTEPFVRLTQQIEAFIIIVQHLCSYDYSIY